MKDTIAQALKERLVISCEIIALSLYLIFFTSCSSSPKSIYNFPDEYKVLSLKSAHGDSQITLNCYDHENKDEKLSAAIIINGVFLNSSFLKTINTKVTPGKYNIEVIYAMKKTVKTPVKVHKGDSLVINVYMRDFTGPVY